MANILETSEMQLIEKVDITKLRLIIDNFDALYDAGKIRQKDRVKNKYTDKKTALTIIHEYYLRKKTSDKIEYAFKHGINWGRMFSKKMSLQGLCKAVRHTIAKDFYLDLDIVNCHPVILLKLCSALGVNTPVLRDLVENRDDYLQDLITEYKIDRETAKAIPLAIINGGERADKLAKEYHCPPPDWLISLQNEVQIIYEAYIKTEEGKNMKRRATDQSKTKKWINIQGSTINYHLCKMENEILTTIVRKLWDMRLDVGVFCFDGCMIYKDERVDDELLKSLEEEIKDKLGYDIRIKVKEMDEAISLDGLSLKPVTEEDRLVVNHKTIAELYYKKNGDEFIYTEEMGWFRLNKEGKYESVGVKKPYGLGSLIFTSVEPELKERRDEIIQAQVSEKGIDKLIDTMNTQIEKLQSTPFMTQVIQWLEQNILRRKLIFDVSKPYGIQGEELNLFEGFYASTITDQNYDPELTKGFVDHINWVCGGDGSFFLDWIAQLIQNPEHKLGVSPILSSYYEGTGKDTIYEMIKTLIGKQYCVETSDIYSVIREDRFNSIIHQKLLINFSEIKGRDTKDIMEKLKHAITRLEDNIEYKGGHKFKTPSFLRFFGSSNNPDMFLQFDDKQRRFWITRMNEQPKTKDYYADLHSSLQDKAVLFSLYTYFKERDISQQKFTITPTEFMKDLRQSCIPFHHSFLQYVSAGDLDNGCIPVKELYEKYSKHCEEMTGKKDAPKMTQTKFSLMLKDMGSQFGLKKEEGAKSCKGTRCMAFNIDIDALSKKLETLGLFSSVPTLLQRPKADEKVEVCTTGGNPIYTS